MSALAAAEKYSRLIYRTGPSNALINLNVCFKLFTSCGQINTLWSGHLEFFIGLHRSVITYYSVSIRVKSDGTFVFIFFI